MGTMRIVLVAAVLAACGGASKPAPAAAPPTAAAPAPAVASGGITVASDPGTGDGVAAAQAAVAKLPAPKGHFVVRLVTLSIPPAANTSCSLSMNLEDTNERTLASVSSGAQVEGSSEEARQECIDAVVADIVSNQIAKAITEHDK